MTVEGGFKLKHLVVDAPDLGGMVRRARCKMSDVGRQQHSCDVFGVGLEFCHWQELGDVAVLDHPPDIAIALRI
jgi:hypothetical protein